MQLRAKKGAIRDFIASMRAKQFAWISNDFQMSVIKIVISILMMIINIIISHYHNIKKKYERQSDNCAGYLKSYNSIICSFTHEIFFFYSRPLFLIWYRNQKERNPRWPCSFQKKWRGSSIVQIFFLKMVDTSLALFKRMQAKRLEMRHLKNSLDPAGDHAYLYPFGN